MRLIERTYRSLYIGLLCNFVIFGVGMTIIGATLPKILSEFSWSYTAAGAVIAAGALGYFLSTYLNGILLQKIGPKAVTTIGLGLQVVALGLFAATPSVALNFFLNLLIGLGQGATEVTINFAVVRMERKGESHLMSLMHAAFSVGAVVGPLVIGFIIRFGMPWQLIYRGLAVITLLMAAAMLLLPFDRVAHASVTRTATAPSARPERQPMFYLAFLMLFLYVGLELGTSNWVSEYFVRVLGGTASLGAFMVSIYWAGILVGRLAVPLLFRKSEQARVLIGQSISVAVTLAAAVLFKNPIGSGSAFFLAGLGCSAIYPLVMTIIGHHFSTGQNRAVGFASTGGGVGSFVFPFVMSAISEAFGIQNGFFLYILLAVVMALVSFLVLAQVKHRPT
ncbi:MAG TPA: MFS transporter [Spirochaetia bacterium]|nr:MFS transporter [Spirochaetia bacterium]